MGVLTESEKEQIRYHMGYLETSFAASIQLGIPRPLQTVFLLESAMVLLVNDYALQRTRKILCKLETLEDKIFEAADTLQVSELGKIKLHPLAARGQLATDSLEGEYVRWVNRLADILGAPKYPYSTRFRKRGPGSIIGVSS